MQTSIHPYPTLIELIKIVSNILDLQTIDKTDKKNKLNHRIDSIAVNPQLIDELVITALIEPLAKVFDKNLATSLKEDIFLFKQEYLKLISLCDASFVSRKDMLEILAKDFFSNFIQTILQKNWDKNMPELISLFFSNESAIATTIDWLSENCKDWQTLQNQEDKKERIYAWKKGINIIATYQIKNLSKSNSVKFILLIAAAIERAKTFEYGRFLIDEIKVLLWSPLVRHAYYESIPEKISDKRKLELNKTNTIFWECYSDIDVALKCKKEGIYENQIEDCLKTLESFIEKNEHEGILLQHVGWLRARYFVFSGKLNNAVDEYKQLINSFLYTGGINQKKIINEALVVTANLSTIDNIFLKELKWIAITFSYDIASIDNNSASNKVSDNIQSWEIELWKNSIYRVFPEESFFPASKILLSPSKTELIGADSIFDIKPDYRNPNKKIYIPFPIQKKCLS